MTLQERYNSGGLISLKELYELGILGVSRRTLIKLAKEGQLKYIQMNGGKFMVDKDSVENFKTTLKEAQ